MTDDALNDLARRAGITVEWQDHAGRVHTVAPDTLREILRALGLPTDNGRALSASRRMLMKRSTLEELPPLITSVAGRPTRLDVGGGDVLPAQLMLESGAVRDVSLVPSRGRLRIPAISEVGYHRLDVRNREIVIAVSPVRCRSIEDIVPDARLWGVSAELCRLRHTDDADVGDLAGAAALAQLFGKRGADAIALGVMAWPASGCPGKATTPRPTSRLFPNPMHSDPSLALGLAIGEEALFSNPGLSQQTTDEAKLGVLRGLFHDVTGKGAAEQGLGADFASFRADGGNLLQAHACFGALRKSRGASEDWRSWPLDLQDPNTPAITCFAAANADEVLFQQFLQWLADRSAAAVQNLAYETGMRIGVIGDFGVGVDPAGSQAWMQKADILSGVTIGAPPDRLDPDGQDWWLTGFSPRALEDAGFTPFLAAIRAAMRHVGGIRIDSVSGLARLWLIPHGGAPSDGAYVRFPLTDLLRLLALESVRHNVVVIADGIDGYADNLREVLDQSAVHDIRVPGFRLDGVPELPAPAYRSSVATTSLRGRPTVANWWKGLGVEMLARAPGDTVDRAPYGQPEQGRRQLWEVFEKEQIGEGCLPQAAESDKAVDAVIRLVAKTDALLSLVPLEDLLGEDEHPNQPFEAVEYPGWRERLGVNSLDATKDETVSRRIDAMANARPRK